MSALLIVLAFLCFLTMGWTIDHIDKDWSRTLFNISTTIFILVVLFLCFG